MKKSRLFGLVVGVLFLPVTGLYAQESGDTPALPAPPPEAAVVPETPPAAAPATAPAPAPTPAYGWKPQVAGQLNLAQNTFDNWSQGGEDSLAWQVTLQGDYTGDHEDYNWANAGKLAFGQVKSGAQDYRKSMDEIRLESVFIYKLHFPVNPYVALKGETQFAKGYDYSVEPALVVSDFLDPGYFTESAGLGYAPTESFKTRFGFAVKETLTRNYPVPYADDPGTPEIEKTKVEYGLESVSNLNLKLSDLVLFTSALNLFSNLKAADQIYVRWDNLLSASVAKYLALGFNLQLIYDHSVSTRRQLSQALTLGLTYTFLE